jgi:Ni/Co efflux regulator RcnB
MTAGGRIGPAVWRNRQLFVTIRHKECIMKKRLGVILFCSVVAMASAPLLAQNHSSHHDDHDRHDQRDHGGHGMYDRGHREGWYRKGGHVPAEYRGGHYVVTDWNREHLRAPPRGYHWVRSDTGDFLLVAAATGVIADLLLHH